MFLPDASYKHAVVTHRIGVASDRPDKNHSLRLGPDAVGQMIGDRDETESATAPYDGPRIHKGWFGKEFYFYVPVQKGPQKQRVSRCDAPCLLR